MHVISSSIEAATQCFTTFDQHDSIYLVSGKVSVLYIFKHTLIVVY